MFLVFLFFNRVHAITSQMSPQSSSSGIDMLEAESFKLCCFQTLTGSSSFSLFFHFLFPFFRLLSFVFAVLISAASPSLLFFPSRNQIFGANRPQPPEPRHLSAEIVRDLLRLWHEESLPHPRDAHPRGALQ